MNYEALKSAITAVIKENGNEEITGDILQQVLVAMVNALGAGYQFAGVATPATDPGTPDQRVFYIAAEADSASYPNFGVTVQQEICVLVYSTSWTKIPFISFDEEVTEGSTNLVSSNAVFQAIANLGDVYMEKMVGTPKDEIAIFDNAGQVIGSGKKIDSFVPVGGIALADGLIDTLSAGTDQEFLYRKSGGDGIAYYKRIKGKTIVWNQLVNAETSTFSECTITKNADGTYTISGNPPSARFKTMTVTGFGGAGHKIYLYFQIVSGSDVSIYDNGNLSEAGGYMTSSQDKIYTQSQPGTIVLVRWTNATEDAVIRLKVIDLTLMFGAGNEPATVAAFEALYPDLYYAYNPGVVKNNDADAIESVGFNQWDEEWVNAYLNASGGLVSNASNIASKNYVPVFPGMQYYIKAESLESVAFYDAEKNFVSLDTSGTALITIPAGCYYLRFHCSQTTYNHDICINLSDPDRNGEYEPYWKKSIQLNLWGFDVEDAGGNIQVVNGLNGQGPDFDEIANGKDYYKRRKRVNLGDLNWTYEEGVGGATYFKSGDVNVKKAMVPGLLCPLYKTTSGLSIYNGSAEDKSIGTSYNVTGTGQAILVKDSAYSDAAAFKAAMNGVYAEFTLATEEHYTLVDPITQYLQVDEDGTERAVPPEDETTPSAPFVAQTTYSVSIANLTRILASI